ncbi:MAG: isocitrate lyase/phosphoenolpyruvate mutase family protein, partial [Natronosporangium sp.]
LRAAREAAAGLGVADFVINARTDVFLRQVGDPAGRLDQVLDRAQDYATAGADVLFVPGLLDLRLLRDLVAASPLPVNAMAAPNGPTIAELSAAGVRRVSLGAAIASAAYSLVQHATREVLEAGTYATLSAPAGHPDLDARLG